MTGTGCTRIALGLLAAVFVLLQSYSLSHAAEFAFHDCEHGGHDHDGIECDLEAVSKSDDAIVPASVSETLVYALGTDEAIAEPGDRICPHGRLIRPPARGPPRQAA